MGITLITIGYFMIALGLCQTFLPKYKIECPNGKTLITQDFNLVITLGAMGHKVIKITNKEEA